MIEKSVVEIFTSEEGVAVGWLNLKHALLDFQNTNIEGSTAKIENSDTKNKTKLVYIPEDENNLSYLSLERSNLSVAYTLSSDRSIPYASAAAVGSLMTRRTLSPAICPASLVAWRWESLKYCRKKCR